MPSQSDFNFQFGKALGIARATPRDEDGPMRILIMGDFSGRGLDSGIEESGQRPVVAVDVDNFEQVFARYAPTLHLPVAHESTEPTVVQFQDLDDFHPDAMYERLDVFQSLRELRQRLLDPSTFEDAAARLRAAAAPGTSDVPRLPKSQDLSPDSESDGQMLSRLLGQTPAASLENRPVAATVSDKLTALIRDIVQPYIVPAAAPDQLQLVQSVDMAISAEMRRVLHDPSFQSLESIWRGVRWLLNELELGADLQLYLLDVTKAELQHDFACAREDGTSAVVYQRIVEQEVGVDGSQPWSLLVGHYSFGPEDEDCQLLAAMGHLASHAGGPMIAAASSSLLGCESIAASPEPTEWKALADEAGARWHALRQSTVAPWLGLAFPRVLLRLPYGQTTDQSERFRFEELSLAQDHENYLWGNPAIACALLIGKSFQERGWSMEPGDDLELGELAAHSYESDGETRLKPCAEVCLPERVANSIMEQGLMTLMSYKNRNAVRLMRFQSLADPVQTLAGPWR